MALEVEGQQTRDLERRLPVIRRAQCELGGGVDVAVLAPQHGDAFPHPAFQHVDLGGLRHPAHMCQVRETCAVFLACKSKLFQRELTDCFEQPVARRADAVVDRHQGLIRESREQIDDALGRAAKGGRHVDHRIDRPTLDEHAEPCKQPLFLER